MQHHNSVHLSTGPPLALNRPNLGKGEVNLRANVNPAFPLYFASEWLSFGEKHFELPNGCLVYFQSGSIQCRYEVDREGAGRVCASWLGRELADAQSPQSL